MLVGDPRQLQAVGRGGMFAELCATSRTIELERIHRFTNPWEAAASLQLRHGNPRALDAYLAHDRIIAGPLVEHLDTIADQWLDRHTRGDTTAITTTSNEHVDAINHTIQQYRLDRGDLDTTRSGHDRRRRRCTSVTSSPPVATNDSCTPATGTSCATATCGP